MADEKITMHRVTDDAPGRCASCAASVGRWVDAERVEIKAFLVCSSCLAHARTDIPALLADLDAAREALREAQSTVADLLYKRDAWQHRAEEATLRNADLAAERDRMRPVVDMLRAWYGTRPAESATTADNALMAVWEAYCETTGECFTCGRDRCTECKVCPLCAGDGHAEQCSQDAAVDTYETQEGTDGRRALPRLPHEVRLRLR